MTTAIIADDEPNLAQYLKERLEALWPELKIAGVAPNGLEAAKLLTKFKPDIAFLDIKMPGLTGLQVADQAGGCHCVFVTAYDQYALTAFEKQAIDYLLKPVSDDRLIQAINRLKQRLATAQPPTDLTALLTQLKSALQPAETERLRWIRAGIGNEVKLVAIDEVCYFQASDKYTAVVTAEGEYLIRTPLKELSDQLDPDQFWQIHRSTLVNVRQIAQATREITGKVTLSLKARPEKLTASRAFAHLFKQM